MVLVRRQLLLLAILSSPVQLTVANESPNVLLIAIDDLNDWVGCLAGHPQVKTPHIDRLASRGTLFSNAHCQAPLCNPSRTSLMTGTRPSTNGVYGLSPWFRDVPHLKDLVAIPEYFAQNSYATLATGKVFHGHYGLRVGDHEFQETGPKYDDGPRPSERIVPLPGNPSWKNDWGVHPLKDDHVKGDWKIASWAIEQLDQQPQQPFFLSVGIRLPHVPLFASQKWFDLYPKDSLQMPPVRRDDRSDTPRFSWYLHWDLPEPRLWTLEKIGQWKSLVRSYLACISFLDSQVGRLLDALQRNRLDRNTIVVLYSDHGWHLGEKLITGKNTLWERSTRVPLIFAGPKIAAGTCDQPVELLDIFPTLIQLCNLRPIEQLEGHSLVPQLINPLAERSWPAITTANQNNHAVRSKRWRFIQYADGSEELYDMQNDPNEWTNLVKNRLHSQVIAQHRKWLPVTNAKPVAGSRGRILERINGNPVWEGKEILEKTPIP